ncbi:MAG: molybdopterin cofactor-binding domain-containing protein, partial [bacterium]
MIRRLDGPDKVTGVARFPADLIRTGFLHAQIVFTDQPHARLVRLDVAPALATPGVVDVITAADIPVNEYGLVIRDQPVLIGVGNNLTSVAENISRWEADQLCVVIAESIEAARAGAAAIEVEWEELAVLGDIDSALESKVMLHPENGLDINAYHHLRIRKGDIDAGWAATEVVIEGTYELPYQEHAYLQPEAAISYIDELDRLTVEIAGQWTVEDQEQIAHALDLPIESVRVIY